MIALFTGGSANGKSSWAEALVQSLPAPHYYVATMQPFGAYEKQRIARHLALRAGKDFITLERYVDLDQLELPEPGGTVLLECLCTLASNEMFDHMTWEQCDPVPAVLRGVEALARACDNLILVSNDVGSDLQADYSQQTGDYIRALGTINCMLAAQADLVVECAAGSPQVLKGRFPAFFSPAACVGASRWDDGQE